VCGSFINKECVQKVLQRNVCVQVLFTNILGAQSGDGPGERATTLTQN
jgi:hypothetical protein